MRSLSPLLLCAALVLLSASCLDTPTKHVPMVESVDSSVDANGEGGMSDVNVPVACDGDDKCTQPEASRCDLTDHVCKPCETNGECLQFPETRACVHGQGCFQCSDEDKAACTHEHPVCDSDTHKCVECTTINDALCTANKAKPYCDEKKSECVGCRDEMDCKTAEASVCSPEQKCTACTGAKGDCLNIDGKHVCNTDANKCVECMVDADCGDPTKSKCNSQTKTCEPCQDGDDTSCEHFEKTKVCGAGTCVECTKDKRDACSKSAMGAPGVCDALTHACSKAGLASADVCDECVSDAQCKQGQRCVHMTLPGTDQQVGWFCQWVKDGGGGAPPICDPNGRPYVSQGTMPTIDEPDGSEVICSLAVAACPGIKAFRTSCGRFGADASLIYVDSYLDPDLPDDVKGKPETANMITPDDAPCGIGGKCVAKDTNDGAYRCTVGCNLSDNDCPGTSKCKGTPPGIDGVCGI